MSNPVYPQRGVGMSVSPCLLTLALGLLCISWVVSCAAPGPGEEAALGSKEKPGPLPVIYDTDIGDDIDDTWALSFLLKCPELDLKLVTTDFGNTRQRAKIVARILETAKRTDVPIGVGVKLSDKDVRQASWVKDYDLSKYPGTVHTDGVQALIDTIMKSPKPVTLICVGPVPNIKAALEREPRIVENARFVGMHGSVRKGYGGKDKPDAEYNVRADAKACQAALSAAWDVTITPLDTCGLVHLRGEKYAAVRDCKDPVVQALMENYRIWLKDKPERAKEASSTLFDTVAVYLALSEDLCVMENLGIRVDEKGFTLEDPKAKKMDCAMEWNSLSGFEDFLVSRLTAVSK